MTRTLHDLSADQAVERPATLEDVRTQVLTPQRLNAFVFSAFGGIALLIAVVGVAGVLAFSVGARTREFGVRLALGLERRRLLGAGPLGGCVRIAASESPSAPRRATRSAASAASCRPRAGYRAPGRAGAAVVLWAPPSSPRCCPPRARRAWTSCRRCARSEATSERQLAFRGERTFPDQAAG